MHTSSSFEDLVTSYKTTWHNLHTLRVTVLVTDNLPIGYVGLIFTRAEMYQITICWDVTPYPLISVYQRTEGT